MILIILPGNQWQIKMILLFFIRDSQRVRDRLHERFIFIFIFLTIPYTVYIDGRPGIRLLKYLYLGHRSGGRKVVSVFSLE